tara:strand:+ start:380 stop:778 length:399 start_codon:yes stop_codon:yes gene_type:complete
MYEVSDSLDKNWSREIILSKIKKGQATERIVNDFIEENKNEVNKLIELINLDNYKLLDNLITLSECELKLIKKLKDLEINKIESLKTEDQNIIAEKDIKLDISLFLTTWSNKFVIIALIAISLISLTKQAWA